MKYFSGQPTDLGTVTALPFTEFKHLRPWLEQPAVLKHTRAQYLAMEPKDRAIAKRVAYLTPAAFTTTPSPRKSEHVSRCNLIALDIDSAEESKRLLLQGWTVMFPLAFVAWHTASSTEEAPRIRVIVAADSLAPGRYALAVKTVAERMGLTDVTHESLVPVQPMFLPTVFSDDSKSPIIAAHFDGEAFTADDIVNPQADEVVNQAPVQKDEVLDITFLQLPLEGFTLADAEQALSHLDPDCGMLEWIETGAALKHQFEKEDAKAYQIWDTWSARGKKYVDATETSYRWGTLKGQTINRSPVTIRSVLRRARARGWSDTAMAERTYTETLAWINSTARSTEELMDKALGRIIQAAIVVRPMEKVLLMNELRAKMKKHGMPVTLTDMKRQMRAIEIEEARTTGMPAWAKGICYVTALDRFYRPSVDRRFKPEVLDLMYSAPPIAEETMRARDYLTKIVNIPQVENLRYDPAKGETLYFKVGDVPFVNTYRKSDIKADPDRADEAGAVYLEHLGNLIKEEGNRRILTDYLAFLHQQPGRKIRWSPLLQSTKGAGKTFIAAMLAATLGHRNVKKLDPLIVMDGKHNDWAYGAQIVIMEEVRIVGTNRHAVMDRLKPCISDDEICVRAMYEPPKTVPNITNYLMFTNHHDSLAIQDDERRYFVVCSPLQRPIQVAALGGVNYFHKLYAVIKENPEGLKAFFENWEISPDFNPDGRAPETSYFLELVENAASPLAAAIKQAISDESAPLLRKDLLSIGVLKTNVFAQGVPFTTNDQVIGSILREMGWKKQGRHMICGERHQLWSFNELTIGQAHDLATSRLEVL